MTRGPAPWAAITRYPDLEAVSAAAAAQLVTCGQAALAARGRFALALPGGSTPRRLFALLASQHRDALDWGRAHFWWGDERAVPPDHPDSNYGLAHRTLLAPLGIAAHAQHRLHGEALDLAQAALDAARELTAVLGEPPALDLVVLGLGSDGHTASWFPHSPVVSPAVNDDDAPRSPWVVANPVSSPLVGGQATRLTLTPRAVLHARAILVLVSGRDKARALSQVLRGALDPAQYPAQLLAGAAEKVQWLVDHDAANDLGDLHDPRG